MTPHTFTDQKSDMENLKRQRTRVTIRRLPPGITLEALKETLEPWINMFSIDKFHKGKQRLSPKSSILAYAYLNFNNTKDIVKFHNEFNGHLFRDNRKYYKAIVEYSLLQHNPIISSLESEPLIFNDPEYQDFASKIEKGVNPWSISLPDTVIEHESTSQSKKKKKPTPPKKTSNIVKNDSNINKEETIAEKAQRFAKESSKQRKSTPGSKTKGNIENNQKPKSNIQHSNQSMSEIAKKAQQLASEARSKRQNTIK